MGRKVPESVDVFVNVKLTVSAKLCGSRNALSTRPKSPSCSDPRLVVLVAAPAEPMRAMDINKPKARCLDFIQNSLLVREEHTNACQAEHAPSTVIHDLNPVATHTLRR